MYAQHGDPMQALSRLDPPVPVLHVYVEPKSPKYLSATRVICSGAFIGSRCAV